MFKKVRFLCIISLMITLIVMPQNISYAATSGECGNNLRWSVYSSADGGHLVITGSGAMKDYTYTNTPFSSLNITKITIYNGATSIGKGAFQDCVNLKSIIIPDSITSIGERAFFNCTSLTALTIPDGVISIGKFAFYGCEKLESMELGVNVSNIEPLTFYGLATINDISVNDKNSSFCDVDGTLFTKDMTKLIKYGGGLFEKEYTVPDGVITINSGAFSCALNTNSWTSNWLDEIVLPDSLVTIGDRAFEHCSSLDTLLIPSGVTSIGAYAFSGCSQLKSISIPVVVKNINDGIFQGCASLTSVVIPSGVTNIGNSAFSACLDLIDVSIPNSVTSIGNGAFANCNNLEIVRYNGTEDDFANITIDAYNNPLKNAEKFYFLHVEILDMSGNIICKRIQDANQIINISDVIDENSAYYLYYDNQKVNRYDINSKKTSTMVLYAEIFKPKLETISISGRDSSELGEIITETVFFATNKDVNYILCNIKYPDSLELKEIIPVDFMYAEEESRKTENGFTTLSVYCQYANSGNVDKNKTIIPFELKFEIDKYSNVGDASIEILNTTEYGASSTAGFDSIENTNIKILPKLAESITISGKTDISDATTYTATIIPDYTTNKNIEWSVSDATIATITQEGGLKPVMNGQVVIYAKTLDGSNLVAEKLVNISAKAKLNTLSTSIGDWECAFYEDQREYTIYVPEDATQIGVTATYDGEGVMRIGGSLTRSGVTRNIELTNDITPILIERTGVGDNYIDSEYTITVIKTKPFTKVTVSEDGKLFNVRAYLVDNYSKIILALYKDKRFITLYDDLANQGVTIPFTVTEDYDTAKVMVWENWDTLRPLCEVEEINR